MMWPSLFILGGDMLGKLAEFSRKRLVILSVCVILFHSTCFFHNGGAKNQVSAIFGEFFFLLLLKIISQICGKLFNFSSYFFVANKVYYQNYEYLSTVKLNDYSGYYGNAKLLRYSIPSDVLSAIWRLQLVATESCPATNVYL